MRTAPPGSAPPAERRLPNGLRVLVEPMPWTEAVAVELVLPLGAVTDPEDAPGSAALLWEWLDRGAGGLDARAREEAFAALGIGHGGTAGRDRSGLSATLLADVLPRALELLADEAAAPNLDEAEFETARAHALEELEALEDRPAELLNEALDARAFRPPWDRSAYGTTAGIDAATPDGLRALHGARARPEGAILVLAGGVEADAALDAAETAFGGWRAATPAADAPAPPAPSWAPAARHDVPLDAAQVQIGLAWPLLPAHDPRAAAQSLGMGVLAGGTGARLFREVREARGLAYAVSAGAVGVAGAAWASAHAATTPERAEATLRVLRHEVRRLREGVRDDELERARTLLRTREATRGESSGGRAGQIVQDLVLRGRARSLEERLGALLEPDVEAVDAALAAAPEAEPTVVVMGPRAEAVRR